MELDRNYLIKCKPLMLQTIQKDSKPKLNVKLREKNGLYIA